MSAIEVLSEQVKGLELMKGSKLYAEHSKKLHEDLEEALLALGKAEEIILEEVKVAAIESDQKIHIFENSLQLKRLRQIPASPQVNVNINLQLPATINQQDIPEETQKLLQQYLQDSNSKIVPIVQQEIIRQSPQLDIQIIPLKGGWIEK